MLKLLSFPVHLKVGKHPKTLNFLKIREYPSEEPNIIHNHTFLFMKAILVVFCRLTGRPSVLHHLYKPESLSHDVRDSIYKVTTYHTDNIIAIINEK